MQVTSVFRNLVVLYVTLVFGCVSRRDFEDRIAWARQTAKQDMQAQAPLRRMLGKSACNVYSNFQPHEIACGIGIAAYVWRDIEGNDDGVLLRWCAANPRLAKIVFQGPSGVCEVPVDDAMQRWHLDDAKTTVEYEISFAPTNSVHYDAFGALAMPQELREWFSNSKTNARDCVVTLVQRSGRNIGPLPFTDGAAAWQEEKQLRRSREEVGVNPEVGVSPENSK